MINRHPSERYTHAALDDLSVFAYQHALASAGSSAGAAGSAAGGRQFLILRHARADGS